VRAVLRRPRRAGTSIVAGAEADRSHAAGVDGSFHRGRWGTCHASGLRRSSETNRVSGSSRWTGAPCLGRQSARLSALSARSLAALGFVSWGAGSRSSGFWTGRLRREGSRDELACPARGQTNFGGQRMTEAAAEASELASVSEARTGDALAGVTACLAGFYEVERSGVVGRHRAPRLGAVPPPLCASAARWWEREGAWPTGVERSEKPASQAPWELEQGSSFSRCYARPSEPASDGRVKS